MNPEQIFNKVAEMRNAQKAYFANRDPFMLRKSKALEDEIDRVLTDAMISRTTADVKIFRAAHHYTCRAVVKK